MNRVSGTTGITGAADSTFVLEKLKREGTRAKFICTGRDIDDRIMELNFDRKSKLWDLIADSVETPEILLEDIAATVVKFMKDEKSFSGTPAELAERLSAYTKEEISPIVLSKRLNQNIPELEEFGVRYKSKRSNGKRLIFLSGFPQNPDGFVGGGEHTEQESLVACNETIKRCDVRRSADMRGRLRGSVCLTNNRHEKSLQSNPVSFLSVVRMKTRRKQNNPVNCFVAESPFQKIRAIGEV